ncbi:MAG: response regulator [Rhodocyclaceae bacterium]|nr:response regulator [Rhodocyclaceae bacterium]
MSQAARGAPRLSFVSRLTVVAALLVTVVTTILVVLLHQHELTELTERAEERISASLSTRERLLLRDIDRVSSAIGYLAGTPPLAGIGRARAAGGFDSVGDSSLAAWEARLARIFSTFASADPTVRLVRLLGPDGREAIRVERHGSFVRSVDSGNLQDKSDRPYFRDARRKGPGVVVISPIGLNQENGRVEEPHWATLRVAMLVAGPDGPVGVLVINYEADAVLASLNAIQTPQHRFFLAGADGGFVIHPDPAKAFRGEYAAPYGLADALPGLEIGPDRLGLQEVRDEGKPTLAIARQVSLPGEILDGGVTLIETIDPQRLEDTNNDFIVSLLPTIILSSVGLFVIAWLLLYRQLSPLAQLSTAARAITAGNLDVSIDDHDGVGEVGAMAKAFSTMLVSLRARQAESEHLHGELQASEAFANAIVRGSPNGILVINEEGLIVRSNDAADRMFHYERGALVGRPVEVLVPLNSRDTHATLRTRYRPDDAPRLMGERGRHLAGQCADGSSFAAEIALANMSAPDGRFVIATISDVSEQRHRQAQAELLASIVHNSGDFICICTPSLAVRYLNPAAREMLGLLSGEPEGFDLAETLGEADRARLRGEVVPALQNAGRWSGEITLRHRLSRAETHTEWNAFAIRDSVGLTTAWAVIGPDLAERRARATAEAASDAKTTFLAHMSHEMRTPLNAVMSVAYLLSRSTLTAEQRHLVGQLRQAGQQLSALINDVLDLSKIEAGKMELEPASFDLPALLRDMAGLMTHQALEKGLDLRLGLSPDLPNQVIGDPTRLNQVLANLLSNAIKFTEQGSVRLEVAPEAQLAGSVRVRFCVTDTGIGISKEAIAGLFAPFTQADISTTRRFGGTGLGLTISKLLIDAMGGEIEVRSEPGRGSEFCFSLPLSVPAVEAIEAPEAPPPAEPAQAPGLAGVRILVVDDSDINRDIARRLLRLEGATVGMAAHGQEAVDILRGTPEAYDVVVMDLQMPVMDGFAATRAIRSDARTAKLPIVALTAAAMPNERENATEAGMNDFITKPIDPERMLFVIQRLLGRSGLWPNRADAKATPVEPATLGAPEAWPDIAGIRSSESQARLGGDVELLRSLLRRLFEEFADACEQVGHLIATDPALAAQRLHKLRGIAGNLGAEQIAHQAGELETHIRNGELAGHETAAAALATDMRALRAAAADFLASAPAEAGSSDVALDDAQLAALDRELADYDLSALDRFAGLAPALATRLGARQVEELKRRLEDLHFDEVRAALRPLTAGTADVED